MKEDNRTHTRSGCPYEHILPFELFVCCPGFPLPALDSVLGDLLNAFAGDLQFLDLHEGVEDFMRLTLYWPYCRSVRVEGFAPRNPILPWVGATLSWCHRFWV